MALIGKQLALVATLEANAVGTTEIVSNSITALTDYISTVTNQNILYVKSNRFYYVLNV